jgi:hypothetical protein
MGRAKSGLSNRSARQAARLCTAGREETGLALFYQVKSNDAYKLSEKNDSNEKALSGERTFSE